MPARSSVSTTPLAMMSDFECSSVVPGKMHEIAEAVAERLHRIDAGSCTRHSITRWP